MSHSFKQAIAICQAPVVATDASITDWTDPVPIDSMFSAGGKALDTVASYQYCVWTYSDGSTQQQLYATKYATTDGTMGFTDASGINCNVASAP